ncbi:alpha/beta fold hydrolase [Actinoplanes teichomyceticus]|uniref:Pimeloyl-ACP methyl ester carboxylesterase n=1 Tax=Actinoplanes teichomyceticus TaxID=1867 RepID=A0A561WR13_ACTTI|nr:alpha/beta hydrolase [Actinoplanes teichomyceticus]TWG26303.1 pimeloyl-ACP methyl ester carboxylesterase [Actinoplanes teichomyceticus]GIF11382.1 alpha/beta hydrolase [Actinoplanes teichomyceticus]
MRVRISTLAALAVAIVLTGAASVSGAAAAGTHATTRPTIVLVHGAFADSTSWSGVIERLQQRGYPVVAAANPLRGLSSDATYVRTVLNSVPGPIVLAGHSYGGAVMTNAAAGDPDVKALVYIAAFAPDKGESALELSGKFPGSTLGDTLVPAPLGDGTADLLIRQDLFRQQFAADVSEKQASLMAVTQRPIRDAALSEGSGDPAWKTIPSWFLVAGADRNIPAEAQRWMADRAGARATIEIRKASHAVGVSNPRPVADLIDRAATTR